MRFAFWFGEGRLRRRTREVKGPCPVRPFHVSVRPVKVKVRLFAALRESAGRSDVALELPEGATAEDAFRSLAAQHPDLGGRRPHLSAAVNRRYASFDARLAEGDEVVFIPPVSGG